MASRLKLFVPVLLFFALIAVFTYTLLKDDYNPRDLPSALIDKSLPEFSLPALEPESLMLQNKAILGQPFLLNVWATWCVSCRVEHPYFMKLKQQGVKIVGLNYKDKRTKALDWLKQLGNPYAINIFDEEGSLGLDLGVYGAPETYLVDANGVVKSKFVGVVNEEVWQKQFAPIYQQLLAQGEK